MRIPAVIALLLAGGIARGAQSPSDAALAWLREVASGKAEAKPSAGTALSPETSEDDVKAIRSRLTRLRQSLRPEDLRAVADKQDGDLAAVLVSQITNFDANSVQIHAVGLVKNGDGWLPAPLPSSFNSTGMSFRPGFLQRAKSLEEWMLRGRTEQLVRLKDDAFALLTEEMRKFRTPDQLHEETPEKLATDFLAALKKRDLPAVLALMGGLEEPRPADWEETFQVVSRTLRKKEITHPDWRLLAAPEAVRVIVMTEEDANEPLVSIVALDPGVKFEARPRARAVHLPFVRSLKSGTWRIRLTHELLSPTTRPTSPGREAEDDSGDAEMVAKFPAKLHEAIAPVPSESAQAAAKALVSALCKPSLEDLCSHLDLEAAPETAVDAMERAAQLWQRIHKPLDGAAPVLLEVHESGDDACALVQMFSGRSPAEAMIEAIFLQRKDKGWLANPGFSGASALPYAKDGDGIGKWLAPALRARDGEWWEGSLTSIGGIAADSAPSEEEARKVVEEARRALAAGDAQRVFELSACFDDKDGTKRLLRNTGYDFMTRQAGEILGVHRAGRWAAVSLRVPPATEDDSADSYPLVVLAATPAGPRILPELDLYDPLTRSRGFLNKDVWARIDARLPEGARGELESIYEKHRTLSAADRGRLKPTE